MTVTTRRRWLPRLAVAVIVLGFANFLWFMAATSALGGDALNGHVTNGHYYVTSHGIDTEVSEAAWNASRIHAFVTMASWPIVILTMGLYIYGHVFPTRLMGAASEQAPARVAWVRATGAPIWWGTIFGDAGGFLQTSGLLDVAVHPGGVVVKPKFAPASAILTEEIEAVGFGWRVTARTIEIDHAGVDLVTPLLLYGSPDSPQSRAIQWLAAGPMGGPPPVSPTVMWGAPAAQPSPPVALPPPPPAPSSNAAPRPSPAMRPIDILVLIVGPVIVMAGLSSIPTFGLIGLVGTAFGAWIVIANTMRVTGRRRW